MIGKPTVYPFDRLFITHTYYVHWGFVFWVSICLADLFRPYRTFVPPPVGEPRNFCKLTCSYTYVLQRNLFEPCKMAPFLYQHSFSTRKVDAKYDG